MNQEKRAVAEAIWLSYYNHYLFEHGMITEAERNHLSVKINCRIQNTKNHSGT